MLTDSKTWQTYINCFLARGVEPRKIILWDTQKGCVIFTLQEADNTPVFYFGGLEFHIRNVYDVKFFNKTVERLQTQAIFKNLSPRYYPALLDKIFRERMGKPLDLNNPQTFSEKMQWLKLYDSTPLKSRLADKYAVRKWIAEKLGKQYLIPLLDMWKSPSDIDFNDLPDQFVLKCNHGSGMNIVVRDKKNFNRQNAHEKLRAWLDIDFGSVTCQLHYTRIKRKIIAEQFITDGKNPDIDDYKFWCFDGRVEFVQVDKNRSTAHVQSFYATDWTPLNLHIIGHTPDDKISEKPAKLDEMLNIARTLSKGFNIVRVDLYCVEDKIYFGEMTFTPLNGYIKWNPADTDYRLGALIKLNPDN